MVSVNRTSLLQWQDVEPIFRHYLSVWANHIPLNWATMAWQALQKGGLTVYNSETEEMKARSYAVALSLVYYEFCHRTAFHEDEEFHYWNDSQLQNYKNDFLQDAERDPELLSRVTQCVSTQLGEFELAAELWINCVEAKQGFVLPTGQRRSLRRQLENSDFNDFNFSRGREFVLGNGIDSLREYESVGGL